MDKEGLKIESIVNQYLGPVYGLVFRLTQNREMAEDIAQEVFIKVWKNLSKYDSEKSLKTWIFTIARNTAIDWLRKKKVLAFSELDDLQDFENGGGSFSDNLIDSELLPEELLARAEIKGQLEKALSAIALVEKEIILLHLANDLTFEEIADVVGRPLNTVKSRYRRALLKLRELLHQNRF